MFVWGGALAYKVASDICDKDLMQERTLATKWFIGIGLMVHALLCLAFAAYEKTKNRVVPKKDK